MDRTLARPMCVATRFSVFPVLGFLWFGLSPTTSAQVTSMSPTQEVLRGDQPAPALVHPCVASVQIVLAANETLATVHLATLTSQVNRIWAPHGLLLHRAVQGETDPALPAEPSRLRVVLATELPNPRRAQPPWRTMLAYIEFVNQTQPVPVIYVSLGAVRRLVGGAQVHDRYLRNFPRFLQDHYAALVLGRAIAHEIGHYLFASRSHDDRGLMRDRFTTTELVDQSLDRFRVLSAPRHLVALCPAEGETSR